MRREKPWQGQERGKAIMDHNSVLYFKPVAASFSSFASEILLTSFARCFATRKRVLCEHRVLISPGRPSGVEKKICRKQNFKGSHKQNKTKQKIRKKLCWTK